MKVTLLGFTVPDAMLRRINETDRLMQTQTHRFAWSLVGALRAGGAEVDLLSSAPVSDYPGNPKLLWGRGRFEENGVSGLLMPFVNAIGVKHLSRYVACWFVGGRQLRTTRPDWLLVHGVHSPFLWFAVQAARRSGARSAIVLTDPPGVIRAEDGVLRRRLKAVDIWLVKRALRGSDAVIVLARPLATDFAPSRPALVVEGLVSPTVAAQLDAADPARGPAAARAQVVYAGGLHEEYGVRNLVDAVRSMSPRVQLSLFGRGPLEPWLEQQAEEDARIARPRLVDPGELPAIYAAADVLVQPRQADQDFVKYSFPSKLIEYLASGTPVVSTRLPSIPADYEPYVTWAEGDRPDDIAAAIERVLSWGPTARREASARAAQFIQETRSVGEQGRRIVDFLSSVRGAAVRGG